MQVKTAFIVLVTLFIVGCALPEPNKPTDTVDILKNVANTPGELLYNDVFSDPNFVSTNITVLGIRVGDVESVVLAKLGQPDIKTENDFGGIKNWGYSKALGLNSSGVVYHMEAGFVTRIFVTNGMASLLKGNAVPTKSKSEVYTTYGVPERQYYFSFPKDKPVNALTGRFFVYNKHGFESYLAKDREYQYAFVFPMRKLPTTAYEDKPLTPEQATAPPPTPVLMTDTTTLCNQGATFAYELVDYSCKAYVNACEIPDRWIEIDSCENVPQKPAPKPPKANNNTSSS